MDSSVASVTSGAPVAWHCYGGVLFFVLVYSVKQTWFSSIHSQKWYVPSNCGQDVRRHKVLVLMYLTSHTGLGQKLYLQKAFNSAADLCSLKGHPQCMKLTFALLQEKSGLLKKREWRLLIGCLLPAGILQARCIPSLGLIATLSTGPQRPPHTLRGLAKTQINTLFLNGPSRAFVQEEPGVEVGRGTLV